VSVSLCPIATIQAPAPQVWQFLAEPKQYGRWWDARTLSIVPTGPAQAGQHIEAQTRALGRGWAVHIVVERVDETQRQLELTTRLPLGITVYNHITCAPVDNVTCRVTFG
jgi:uncharacterized protein YndB with AHSA1/START domain